MPPFLQRTILKPNFSLRKQLFTSFGVSAFVTLSIVVLLACVSARWSAELLKDETHDVLHAQVENNILQYNLYLANYLTEYFLYLEGAAQLVVEITQDRLMGYPQPGWEDDRFVPFFDTESQGYKYPLHNPNAIRHDWDIVVNVNTSNAREHLINRAGPFVDNIPISTATPSFHMQGSCDPKSNKGERGFVENCTAAHNNIETGGLVAPSLTTKPLFEKAADIGLLLKPIYESVSEIFLLGLYFTNFGAGVSMHFPGFTQDSNDLPYKSIGCEWMENINPKTGRPFATPEEISRCHPEGTMVDQREYNPLERSFFRDFALEGDRMHLYGPNSSPDQLAPLISIGRAVFDRLYV